ncbi:unnamed protein product [Boreogadus saida]
MNGKSSGDMFGFNFTPRRVWDDAGTHSVCGRGCVSYWLCLSNHTLIIHLTTPGGGERDSAAGQKPADGDLCLAGVPRTEQGAPPCFTSRLSRDE